MTEQNPSDQHQALRSGTDPMNDPAVRRQLEQMFGESLFGAWPEIAQGATPSRRRRSFSWLWKLGVVATVALGLWGSRAIFKPGLERQVEDQRGHYATELQSFVNDGDLARAEQFLPLMGGESSVPGAAPESGAIDPKHPYLDLIVGTEALLYRYHDAKPERLQRIRPFIEDLEKAKPRQLIASLTVVSREERALRLPELERLRNEQPNDNELEHLFATALEHRGVNNAAIEAWERAAKLGPAWLGQRFEQAFFEWHRDRKTAAEKTARQILRVDPDSAWAKLAAVTFALPKDIAVESVRGDAAVPAITPVQRHFELLQGSIRAAQQQDAALAKTKLVESVEAIQQQPAFLLDAFDWLLIEELPELARELTKLPGWPIDSSVARSKLERLAVFAATHTKPHQGSAKPSTSNGTLPSKQRKPTSPKVSSVRRKR